MANYSIESTVFLGCSHSGPMYASGEGTVELTNEEVAILVGLIKEKKSTDVVELGLEEDYPELYEKLDDAYSEVAYSATELHWMREGLYEGVYDIWSKDLLNYCKENCGFKYDYNEADYLDEDGDLDEDALEDDEMDEFASWIKDYIMELDDKKAREFLVNQLGAEVNVEEFEYDVDVPAEIVEMAKK